MAEMRLIDANALHMYKVKIVHAFGIVEGCVVFPDDIAKAPTIDAVPVVRCRDCKEWRHGLCKLLCADTPEDGYCYCGAKMDGGAADG